MSPIIANTISQCNNYFNQSSAYTPYASASLDYVIHLMNASDQIEMSKSCFGLFEVMAETCLTYSKQRCFKRQRTLGYENKYKPLSERQTRTHQRTLLGGFFERDHRPNKRLPYEHAITDLGIVHYLVQVKKLTSIKEIAIILGRFRKLPVENYKNCRSQEDPDNEYKKIKNCTYFEHEKDRLVGKGGLETLRQRMQI